MALALGTESIMIRNGRALYISKEGTLYVSNGYNIFCSDNDRLSWRLNATVHEKTYKAALAKLRIPARFLRYYVAALRVLSDGTRIAVARDGVYLSLSNETRMSRTFEITRGSRPLNITIDDNDRILFGEYGDYQKVMKNSSMYRMIEEHLFMWYTLSHPMIFAMSIMSSGTDMKVGIG